MFYVRGKSFISSLSNPPDLVNIEEGEYTDNPSQIETITPSVIIHCFLLTVDRLPAFLFAASFMSLIAYLYTLLLIPFVTTVPVAPIVNISVPLDIGCPQLAPRTTPATSVHDLRPDDIKVVAGLGDRYFWNGFFLRERTILFFFFFFVALWPHLLQREYKRNFSIGKTCMKTEVLALLWVG